MRAQTFVPMLSAMLLVGAYGTARATTYWDFGGMYQVDTCGGGVYDVGNAMNLDPLGHPQTSCSSGYTAFQVGKVMGAESLCHAAQFVCYKAVTVAPSFAIGGAFQVNGCMGPDDVLDNVGYPSSAGCPAGTTAYKYGRIKAPEGGQCGVDQFYCYVTGTPVQKFYYGGAFQITDGSGNWDLVSNPIMNDYNCPIGYTGYRTGRIKTPTPPRWGANQTMCLAPFP